jgi:hypothetical protein
MRKSWNGLYTAGFLLCACVILLTCGVSAAASASKSTGSSATTYNLTPHVFPGANQWSAVASSADGTKLIAVGGPLCRCIYTSTDSGATWTQQTGAGQRYWGAVASSSDGTKLVAAELGVNPFYDTGNGGYILYLDGFRGHLDTAGRCGTALLESGGVFIGWNKTRRS